MEFCPPFIPFIGGRGEGIEWAVRRAAPTGDVLPHGNAGIRGKRREGGVERVVNGAVQVAIEVARVIVRFGGGQGAFPPVIVLAVGDDEMLDTAVQCA